MHFRNLGRTGLAVSEIGFGGWGIGGARGGHASYGPTDDRESASALLRALDLGVNLFDTSDIYGHGHGESLIGRTLGPFRRKVVITSKTGYVDSSGKQDFSAERIRRSAEESLKRLQTDYIDLYQLHDPPMKLLRADPRVVGAMDDLLASGLIRAIGVSVRSPDDGLTAVREFGFKNIQVNFNMVDQRAVQNGLFDLCAQNGIGVICRTPLSFGFLTGKYSADTEFGEGDHRRAWSGEQRAMWATSFERFATVVQGQGQTSAQTALRFCLSYPAVSTAIPGMLNPRHVEENAAASDLGPLPAGERQSIERIYSQNTFFLGARRRA